jgi:hypothetical protein
MRDFKGMKRQRGRNRNGGGAGGKPQQHNANRAFDSNGPEGIKVRGNAQHVFEKDQQLARDAQTSGDRVLAENYLQHAEHYFRVIRAVTPTRSPADILGRDAVQGGYDIDFEDESGAQAYAEAQAAEAEQQGQQNQNQQGEGGDQQGRRDDRGFNRDRDRDRDRNRDDRPRDRDDRPRDRDDRPRDDRGPRQDRFEGRRDRDRDRNRDDRPREDRGPREDRVPNPAADPLAVVEPQATPLPIADADSSPVLRSGDGEVSRAPNFLSGGGPRKVATLTPDAGEEPAPKPKRRRAPKSFEGGEAPAPAEADEG